MFLSSGLAAFILTFFGMMFLFAELMVKLRGLAGVLGIGFIVLYFSAHLSSMNVVIVSIIFLAAILLLIIDGKLLNDGTLSVISIIMILLIIALSASEWTIGLYGIIGVILGTASSFLFLKAFPKRKMWDKIALMDRLSKEAGYNTLKEEYTHLLHLEGEALTPLRPVGTIRINGKDYSAVSNGVWIDTGAKVKVVLVDGTKILVEVKEN